MQSFNQILKELMLEYGLNSQSLADKLSLKRTTVNRWTRKEYSIKLVNLILLANYFNCSIEFLAGRTEVPLSFTPKPCPPFIEQLKTVMNILNVSTYRLDKETPIKHVYLHRWRHGGEPLLHSLVILADYFGCTIDQLVGRESLS